MYCEHCGNKLEAGEEFCSRCGKPAVGVSKTSQPTSHKKKSYLDGYRIKDIDLVTAEKHTKNAVVAALIAAGLTGLMIVLGVMDAWNWFDVGLVLLFALGVYKKNRIAAIGLFIYFVIAKLVQISEVQNFNLWAGLVALSFLNYFYLGMIGAIRYQQLVPKIKRRLGVVFGVVVGSLATIFIIFLLLSALPEDASPQDIILQADYQEGYKAGYVDGRASQATLGDSYVEIATEERRGAYDIGYLKGFLDGCHEGGFDCTEIEQTINEALGDTELPDDSGVQLIPNSI